MSIYTIFYEKNVRFSRKYGKNWRTWFCLSFLPYFTGNFLIKCNAFSHKKDKICMMPVFLEKCMFFSKNAHFYQKTHVFLERGNSQANWAIVAFSSAGAVSGVSAHPRSALRPIARATPNPTRRANFRGKRCCCQGLEVEVGTGEDRNVCINRKRI